MPLPEAHALAGGRRRGYEQIKGQHTNKKAPKYRKCFQARGTPGELSNNPYGYYRALA